MVEIDGYDLEASKKEGKKKIGKRRDQF